jgi:hypothetical protein
MAEYRKKGWHPDPYGIHAERYYFLDNEPGRLVRDDGRVEFYDEIPEDAPLLPPPDPLPEPPPASVPYPAPPNHPDLVPAPRLPVAVPIASSTAAATGAPVSARSTPRPVSPPPAEEGLFPDEPVHWRTTAATRFSWVRPPTKRLWVILGTVGFAVALAIVLSATVFSGSTKPSSAGSPPAQLRVPAGFLNGSRSSTASTSSAAATNAAWSRTGTYAASAQSLTGVTCPSASQCYAVGESTFKSALVLVSTNDGGTWTQAKLTVPGTLSAIACWSPSACDAVGETTIASTTDGGSTWTTTHLGSGALTAISCPSATDCVVAGSDAPGVSGCDSGTTYASTNGGQTWKSTPTECFVPSGLSCATASVCTVVGTHSKGTAETGEILTTHDAGTTWGSPYALSETNTQFSAVSCPSVLVCVAVGNAPAQSIVRSENGGRTWSPQVPSVPATQRSFLSIGCASTEVCSVGGSAAPVGTVDGGASWTPVTAPSTVGQIAGVSCPSTSACIGVAGGASTVPTTLKLSA